MGNQRTLEHTWPVNWTLPKASDFAKHPHCGPGGQCWSPVLDRVSSSRQPMLTALSVLLIPIMTLPGFRTTIPGNTTKFLAVINGDSGSPKRK